MLAKGKARGIEETSAQRILCRGRRLLLVKGEEIIVLIEIPTAPSNIRNKSSI